MHMKGGKKTRTHQMNQEFLAYQSQEHCFALPNVYKVLRF